MLIQFYQHVTSHSVVSGSADNMSKQLIQQEHELPDGRCDMWH